MKRITFTVALVLMASTAFRCIDPPENEPMAPTSEIQLAIPITDITSMFGELFTDDSGSVKPDGVGGFYFSDLQESEPTPIDTIKVQPQSSGSEVGLGAFTVAPISPLTFALSAGDLNVPNHPGPPAPAFPGDTITLPVQSFDISGQFDFLAVNQGSLTLTISNTLPLTVSFPGPIQLRNVLDNSVVASFVFDSLQEGQSNSSNADLAGGYIEGGLSTDAFDIIINGHPGPFTFAPGAEIGFEFSSSAIVVDSAAAIIPSQDVASFADSVITIDDSISVESASFTSGTFTARVVNNLGINVGVLLKFDNFQSTSLQDTMKIAGLIPPRTTQDFVFDMDTMLLVDPVPDALGTQMVFSAHIETINSGGLKSTVTKNDFIRAEFLPSPEFVVGEVTGKVPPIFVPIDAAMPGFELGDANENLSGSFSFDSVQIDVDLGITGGFPIGYDFYLEGKNSKTNTTARIPATGTLTGTILPNTQGRISIGNDQGLSAFLAQFVPNFPDSLFIRGLVTVNPNFTSGTIADTTQVTQRAFIYFPLKFGLAGGEAVIPSALDGGDFPEDFAESVVQSSLRFSVTNRMPVAFGFKASLVGPITPGTDTPRGEIMTIPVDGVPRVISAAPVDAAGAATGPVTSNFEVTMTPTDMATFNRADSMYFRLTVQSSGDGTQPVRYQASDYIRVRLSGSLIYLLNK